MATLGKIRNHGVLLLIFIGAALLIFIVTDFINNGQAFFNDQKANVGKINGEKIKYQDFYTSIAEYTDFYKIEMNNESMDDEMTEQIRQETWNQVVMRKLVEEDASRIGMTVPLSELKELTIGDNPSPIISGRKIFRDENGVFNPTNVASLISKLDDAEVVRQVQSEDLLKMRHYWSFLEQTVKNSCLSEKYNVLMSKALVINSLEAKYAYEDSKTSVDLVYAMKPYFVVPDSTVSVSMSAVNELYNKRKEQFKQEATCDISYVVFDIKPSAEDFQAVEENINEAKAEFISTEDIVATTNDLSDVPYQDIFLAKEDVANDLQEFAFSGEKNVVFGPFLSENNIYKMAKIVEKTHAPDSVKLSSFPINNAQSLEDLKHKTDSMMKILTGANFEELGGKEIGWLRETYVHFPKEVRDAAFKASVNVPFTVEMNGYQQILCVTEKTSPVAKVKLAVIQREVAPSKQTQAKILQDATQFGAELTGADKMAEKAQEKGYFLIPANNLTRNAQNLGNVKHSREIIRWAFESNVNSITDVKECGTQLVVAGVTRKNKEGYRAVEDVKPMLETELRRDKKFDILKKEFEGKSIEQLKSENYTTDTVRNLAFGSTSAGSLGNDAAIFALAPIAEVNKISAPVKGNSGTYVFTVLQKNENPMSFDAKNMITMMNMKNQNMFYYVIEALKKTGDVKDERYKFY